MLKPNNLYLGDCLDLLAKIEDEKIDVRNVFHGFDIWNRFFRCKRDKKKLEIQDLCMMLIEDLLQCTQML